MRLFLYFFAGFMVCLAGFITPVQAQLSDRLWLGGYAEYPGMLQFELHFEGDKATVQASTLAFNFESTVAVAATPERQLLFYSNGCAVANREHGIMPNGEGLNPGSLHALVCPEKGYIVPQGAMALQAPDQSKRYYLMHLGAEYEPRRKLALGPLYFSEIDMSLQNGLGDVVSKNNVLLGGELAGFTAVRHGNGRDWWILAPHLNGQWEMLLLTPDGFVTQPPQMPPPGVLPCEHYGQMAVSPDGNRVVLWGDCKILLLDFDRCTGQLSPFWQHSPERSWISGGGAAFERSGRFLFLSEHNTLYRLDLETVWLDTVRVSYGLPNLSAPGNTFHHLQTGPNGIIYGNLPSRAEAFHAIAKPEIQNVMNLPFNPRGLQLPGENVRTLPHFPNFQVLDLPGSACDTLGISTALSPEPQQPFKLWPNPTMGQIQLESSFPVSAYRVMDAYGRVVLTASPRTATPSLTINLSHLPTGMYFIEATGEGKCLLGRASRM